MKRKTIKTQKNTLFWRIAISAVGAALILISVGQISLYLFGSSTSVSISTRRVGGSQDGRPSGQRYEWSLDYSFTDQEGAVHNVTTTRRGSDLSVPVDNRVYYFPFAPWINALEGDASPGIGHLAMAGIGGFLIFAMAKQRKIPSKQSLEQPKSPSGGNG